MSLVEHTANDLVTRVEDWHGLEPSKYESFDTITSASTITDVARFGELQRFDFVSAGKDTKEWAELECFLFAHMMIMAKENRENDRRSYTVKGSILWREHVTKISRLESGEFKCSNTLRITNSWGLQTRMPWNSNSPSNQCQSFIWDSRTRPSSKLGEMIWKKA
jgi:hypothetical protein